MSLKSSRIQITPLLGGKSDGGVCSLLEIGGSRILLDCGCTSIADYTSLMKLVDDLKSNGGIDAVLLSHADIHHLGALPCLLGRQGLQDVPIICTLPVFKFGQIVLYDYFLNQKMEGADQFNSYDLDDIDLAFSKIQTVKFSQSATVSQSQLPSNTRAPEITVCALPSGRTIGGSIWRIRCGPAEILYTMDVNLKKEVVLDGASMDLLPTGPALMVVEGASSQGGKKGKKDKDESGQLIATVMETVRNGGNCLLPCETGGRLLELMQLLGKHWLDNKLGNYHLIVLSHMAHNIPEFARMQLEWMSDSLSRSFYNGKPNPFDLPQISFATTVKEVERKFLGPKVVLATDASLSCGLSKELLLKWGGDPRCCVLFTDGSNAGSLAAELRSKASNPPPLLATVSRPFKVELVGEELAQYREEADRQRKLREEAVLRKRRQEELTQLNVVQGLLERDEDEDGGVEDGQLRKKSKSSSAFARFAEPNIVMFETKEINYTWGDYGISNDDLSFQDISTIDTRWQKDKQDGTNRAVVTPTIASNPQSQTNLNEKIPTIEEIPWKLASAKVKVQFTCEFREFNLGARADIKAIKTLITKVTPARLLVLRGAAADCEAVAAFAKTSGTMEAFTPINGASVSFQIMSEKLKVQIPQNLLPSAMKSLRSYSTITASLSETKCSVSALVGRVAESRTSSGQEGTRLVKYLGVESVVTPVAPTASAASGGAAATAAPAEAMEVEQQEENGDNAPEEESPEAVNTQDVNGTPLELVDHNTGVVSVGEVTLNSLRLLIESKGVEVEFRIDASGGVLVCNNEVYLRKVNGNDFVVEGPPVPAYYRARQALYEQFAFV